MFSNHLITQKRILLFLSILLRAIPLTAQPPLDQIAVVHTFTGGSDGANPAGPLIQLSNGSFAGMTFGVGGNVGKPATVFTMTPAGTVTTIYTFPADSSEGALPSGIMQASDGNFYGTCGAGGPYHLGTLFRITPSGVFTKLYNFPPSAGFSGGSPLVEAPDGYLYGVTSGGGLTGFGAIYRFGVRSQKTSLFYSFFSDFVGPNMPAGGISLGPDGRLYGSTFGYDAPDGTAAPGAAYAIDTAGNFSTLAIYDQIINSALAPPFFPNDGYAYFAGSTGGTSPACQFGCGSIYRVAMDGSGDELLYSFADLQDGLAPQTVALGSDGLFYGYNSTAIVAGEQPSIFQVNDSTQSGITFLLPPGGRFGYQQPLLQSEGGVFRGQSQHGGADNTGFSFALNVAAPPIPPAIWGFFPMSGPPGTVVTVWGVGYVGLSNVALNGVTVQAAAKSANFVRFTVPASASSGPITIVTAAGSATSSTSFLVQ